MAGRPPSPPGIRPENSADGNSPLHPVQQAALQRQHELSQQAALLHQENVNLKAALPPGDRPLPVSGPLRPDVAEVLKTPELQANVERLKVGNQSLEEERARRVSRMFHYSPSNADGLCLKVEYACNGCKLRFWLTHWQFFRCSTCGSTVLEKVPDGK